MKRSRSFVTVASMAVAAVMVLQAPALAVTETVEEVADTALDIVVGSTPLRGGGTCGGSASVATRTDPNTGTRFVKASGSFGCPNGANKVTTCLQRQDPLGGWDTVGCSEGAARGTNASASFDSVCAPGTYRSKVRGSSTGGTWIVLGRLWSGTVSC